MAKKAQAVELPIREELIQLAQEVNAVLNLEVAIKFGKKVTDEELAAAIVKECKNNVYEIDFIEDEEDPSIPIYSEEAKETFETLGIKILAGSPPASGKVEEPEDDDENADEPEEDEVPEPVQTKTKKEKAASAAKAEVAPAKAKPAAKAKDSVDGNFIIRNKLLAAILKETKKTAMSKKDIISNLDDKFVKSGGSSDKTMSYKVVRGAIPILIELDVVSLKDDKLQLV